MPIKPENKARYPKDWKQIRERILKRAEDKCEFCGLRNYALGTRDADGKFYEMGGMESETATLEGDKVIKIVLTIAHLDHTPENNDPENLKALCQRCHNRYDMKHRQANAAKTRRSKVNQGMFEKEK